MLLLLQQRLLDDGSDDDGDGYYVRTKEDAKLGPMSERQFNALRDSKDIDRVLSAWRQSGGAFYKVQLRRSIVCDTRHAFSLKACHHVFEMAIIIFCFSCTVAVLVLLVRSPQLKKEQPPPPMWRLLLVLFGITIVVGVFTVRTLCRRWRKESTEVFSSEV